RVALARMERIDRFGEAGRLRGGGFEECHRTPEFQRVDRAEDRFRAARPGPAEHRLGAFDQAWPEQAMVEIGARLDQVGDGVEPRGGASSEPRDLREDEPHPVAALGAGPQLAERLVVDAALRLDETGEVSRRRARVSPCAWCWPSPRVPSRTSIRTCPSKHPGARTSWCRRAWRKAPRRRPSAATWISRA